MPISDADLERLVEACLRLLDLADTEEAAYNYASLVACVIEAIYSINADFCHTRRVLDRYSEYFGVPRTIIARGAVPEETVAEMLPRMEALGAELLRRDVFGNSQWTSTRSGIRKAEAVLRALRILQARNIQTMRQLVEYPKRDELALDFRSIPGQGSGISFAYLLMLAGELDMVKPDRMVGRFVSRAVDRNVKQEESQRLVREAARALRVYVPDMSARRLDYLIWQWEREQGARGLRWGQHQRGRGDGACA